MKCYNEACINYSEEIFTSCQRPLDYSVCGKKLTEPPLKHGDEIEVKEKSNAGWTKKIFICLDIDGVFARNEGMFFLKHYSIWQRPSPSLTWEDRDRLRDKWVRTKDRDRVVEARITKMILRTDNNPYIDNIGDFEELQEHWEFIDGTPIK